MARYKHFYILEKMARTVMPVMIIREADRYMFKIKERLPIVKIMAATDG